MLLLTLAAFVICLGATSAQIVCLKDAPRIYFVDESANCTKYHFCEDGRLSTLVCPDGKAFDLLSSSCELAEIVPCFNGIQEFGSGEVETNESSNGLVVRTKRNAFLNIVFNQYGGLMKAYVRTSVESIFGTRNTVSERVILPILFEMLDDTNSRKQLFAIGSNMHTAFTPIKAEIMRQQGGFFGRPGGSAQISAELLEDAMYEVVYNTQPQMVHLFLKHYTSIFDRVYNNLDIINDSAMKLGYAFNAHWKEVVFELQRFFVHHKRLASESSDGHLKVSSTSGLIKDIIPVGRSLIKFAAEYLRQFPNSIVHVFEGKERPYKKAYPGHPFRNELRKFLKSL